MVTNVQGNVDASGLTAGTLEITTDAADDSEVSVSTGNLNTEIGMPMVLLQLVQGGPDVPRISLRQIRVGQPFGFCLDILHKQLGRIFDAVCLLGQRATRRNEPRRQGG